jgi:hypothetical protein
MEQQLDGFLLAIFKHAGGLSEIKSHQANSRVFAVIMGVSTNMQDKGPLLSGG